MIQRLPLLFSFFFIVPFIMGCGGGGSSSSSQTPQPVAPAPTPPAQPPVSNTAPDLTQQKLLSDAEMETSAITPTATIDAGYAAWIADNHYPIRSITYDQDFSDLAFLKDMIGSKSIVQLGESSHGTAEFNHAKTRLIKYLHQEMGFSVLTFESGFFEGTYADSLRETGSAFSMMRFLFGVWNTDEVIEVFEYVRQTQSGSNPLQIAGFDVQMSSTYYDNIVDFVNALPASDDITDTFRDNLRRDLREARRLQVEFSDQGCFQNRSPACQTVVNDMKVLKDQLSSLEQSVIGFGSSDRDIKILEITLFAAAGQLENSTVTYEQGFGDGIEQRDLGMADVFSKLRTDLYPNEKMIIWAHNQHINHEESQTTSSSTNRYVAEKPMGFYLHERYADDLFSIGLFMLRGSTADNSGMPLTVQAPRNDSLEALAHSVRRAALLVDSRPEQDQVEGNGFLFEPTEYHDWGGQFGVYTAVPSDQFDALLFIDRSSVPSYR